MQVTQEIQDDRIIGALADDYTPFFRRYYKQACLELAREYPSKTTLEVDYHDLLAFHEDSADLFLEYPEKVIQYLEEDLKDFDLPIDAGFKHAKVRVTGLNEEQVYSISELRESHGGQYIGVEGNLQKVSEFETAIETAVFTCDTGHTTVREQDHRGFQEPYQCDNEACNKQNLTLDAKKSTLTNRVEVILKEPPGEASNGSGQELHAYLAGDVIERGGENGILDHSGERVVLYGKLEWDGELLEKGNGKPVLRNYLDGHTIEYKSGSIEDANIEEHKDEFMDLAARDDAHELVRESIAPKLKGGKRLRQVKDGAWAFLFGASRKDDGETSFRGDIHLLMVGDPSTGKSTIGAEIADLSPKCESVSGTNTTGVGLTVAATEDDFGAGQWSLEPGALPKANGGHVWLDEIDKMDSGASQKLHDALEGEQRINVSKAGISADLETRAGFATGGNPVEGRFDRYTPISEQIDMDPALIDRFDLIFAMHDRQDAEQDRTKAEHVLDSITEVSRSQHADAGEVEREATSRPVSKDVLRAWIAYAREHVQPVIEDDAVKHELVDFYVSERENTSADDENRTGLSLRRVEDGYRIAEASARLALRDEITLEDVERAKELTRRVIGDVNMTGDGSFDDTKNTPTTQQDRIKNITELCREEPRTIAELVEETGMEEGKVEHEVEKLMQKGELYEPNQGEFQAL